MRYWSEANISLNNTWLNSSEPNEGNIRQWLDNIYSRYQPIEQARWNQSNIDTLFYAGDQNFVNRYFNFNPTTSYQQYYFNLIQQPINMITGYQRQHRKGITFVPHQNSDPNTTDQYNRLTTNVNNMNGIHETFSKSCELAAIAGMNLMQPYLDYTGDDQAQGEFKVKIWEYNSFIVDPYFRNSDMSDCQFVWCQEYITPFEAEMRFPDKINDIRPMQGSTQKYGNFYFLPENQNVAKNNMYVLSYVWYRGKKRKKRLYSKQKNQFFDFAGGDGNLEQILYAIKDFDVVSVEVPTWKVAVVLNDTMTYNGYNPMGFDECPFVPNFWNYDPHVNIADLRVRSLVRPMRDPQFLYNYKVITNNDITSATINAGWKRKSGAVANEENLKKSGQGYDVIINEGYELSDCEKIIPSGVPESDLALAKEMADLIYSTSGIQLENWAGQDDKQISSLTAMLKMAANLMVFQKYFDQWDYSLKLLGELELKIMLNNWSAEKIAWMIGEEPSPHFYSKVFAKYQVTVEEGLLTPTQRNYQAQQMLDINQTFGREVFPPSLIIKDMNIQGKGELMEFLQNQEMQASEMQKQQADYQNAMEDASVKELYSRAAANIGLARERHGRTESNIGLFEERLSAIQKNRSLSTKAKVEALEKLVDTVMKYGEVEKDKGMEEIDQLEEEEIVDEEQEKVQAKQSAEANRFLQEIMNTSP